MKNKNRSSILIITSVFVLICFVLLCIFYFSLQQKITNVEKSNETLRQDLVAVNDSFDVLQKETELFSLTLSSLDQETKNKILETKKELADTKIGLQEQIKANTKESLDSVANKWRPRVVKVGCFVQNKEGTFLRQGGGTLYKKNSRFFLLTNYHVIGYGSGFDCTISIPGLTEDFLISIDKRSLDPSGVDYVQIELNKTELSNKFVFMEDSNICLTKPPVGREVLILGYPQTGAQDEITVTEGIISAYDGNSYITSAKVDQGNSGGAAIDTSRDCYIGPPSFVSVGFLESLARILDIKTVLPE